MTANTDSRAFTTDAGFSLLETLAALVLTGVLMWSLTLLSGQWLTNWTRGIEAANQREAMSIALDRMIADIESAIAIGVVSGRPYRSFDGTGERIRFIHPSVGATVSGQLEVVELVSTLNEGVIRNRARVDYRRSLTDHVMGDPVYLLKAPLRVRFAFLAPDGNWLRNWPTSVLPAAIRMEVVKGEAPGLTVVAGLRSNTPAICARAVSALLCDSLSAGDNVGLPIEDVRTRRRAPRATAGTDQ